VAAIGHSRDQHQHIEQRHRHEPQGESSVGIGKQNGQHGMVGRPGNDTLQGVNGEILLPAVAQPVEVNQMYRASQVDIEIGKRT
jgi:hypothetical protein